MPIGLVLQVDPLLSVLIGQLLNQMDIFMVHLSFSLGQSLLIFGFCYLSFLLDFIIFH